MNPLCMALWMSDVLKKYLNKNYVYNIIHMHLTIHNVTGNELLLLHASFRKRLTIFIWFNSCVYVYFAEEKKTLQERTIFSKIYICSLHNIRVYNEHVCWQPQFVFSGTTLLAQSAANYPKLSPSHCSLITKIHSLFIPANYFFFLTLLHMTTRVPSLGTLTLEKAWSCQVLYLLPLFLS